ncbi:MAG: peptide/nickel transport system ATP-binding protein [Methylophilaceae bacterium]|jgi:peptide/nickel transport system ATP-binding protein|tara:strand:+ start:18121 stop:18972 length:852 start_codon:yes stop_codon:yes gene_type:complete
MADILSIEHLNVALKKSPSRLLVKDTSFKLASGKTTCIVGESGSGKSLTALTIMGLLSNQLIATGRVLFNGVDLTTLDNRAMQKIRGAQIGMIFQEPMTSLNPVLTVGFQIGEVLTAHQALKGNALKASVARLLTQVGIPETRTNSYPDELSGGQRQRVMVAMSIACEPALLIADEPTTALDVTVQAQILTLLDELKSRMNMAMLFITHDFGVVSDIADDVVVMFRGEIVEAGPKEQVLGNPQHPYTKALLDCVPDVAGKKELKPIDYAWLNHHELSNSGASA